MPQPGKTLAAPLAPTPPTRPQWRTVLLVALALALVKAVLSLYVAGPWFEPDETTYALQGYHIAAGDGLSWRHPIRGMGMPGYALFLALPWLLARGDTDLFLRLALLANCLVAVAALAVGYAALRRWFSHWPALLGAAAMTLYAPVFIYGFTMLSENLFFLFCLLSLWAVQRASLSSRPLPWALAGAAVALCCIMRITGAVFVVALAVTALYELARSRSLRALLAAAAAAAALLVVLAGFFHLSRPSPAPETPPAHVPAKAPSPGTPSAEESSDQGPPGSYRATITALKERTLSLFRDPKRLSDVARSLVLAAAYTLLAGIVLLPLAAGAFVLRNWRRHGLRGWAAADPGLLFLALAVLGTLVAHALVLGLTAQRTDADKMHGRYVDVAVMLIVGYGAASVLAADAFRRRPVLTALAGAVLAVLAVSLLPAQNPLFSGNLGACYALRSRVAWRPVVLLVLLLVVLLPGALRKHPRALGALLVALLAANTAWTCREMFRFAAAFRFYHEFGRNAAPVFADHFARRPDQPNVFHVDKLPDVEAMSPADRLRLFGTPLLDINRLNLIRMFSVCGLELWNPALTAVELPPAKPFPPDSLVFSLRSLPFAELYRKDTRAPPLRLSLRIYLAVPPESPAADRPASPPAQ